MTLIERLAESAEKKGLSGKEKDRYIGGAIENMRKSGKLSERKSGLKRGQLSLQKVIRQERSAYERIFKNPPKADPARAEQLRKENERLQTEHTTAKEAAAGLKPRSVEARRARAIEDKINFNKARIKTLTRTQTQLDDVQRNRLAFLKLEEERGKENARLRGEQEKQHSADTKENQRKKKKLADKQKKIDNLIHQINSIHERHQNIHSDLWNTTATSMGGMAEKSRKIDKERARYERELKPIELRLTKVIEEKRNLERS